MTKIMAGRMEGWGRRVIARKQRWGTGNKCTRSGEITIGQPSRVVVGGSHVMSVRGAEVGRAVLGTRVLVGK